GAEPSGERVSEALLRQVAHPSYISVGPNQHGSGSSYGAKHRKLPRTNTCSADPPDPTPPWRNAEAPGLTEIEQYRSGILQQGEHPSWAVGGDQVKIGHAAPEQRVSRAEVIANVEPRHHGGIPLARLVHLKQLGHGLAQGVRPFVAAVES